MAKFKDNKDVEWEITINATTVMKIRDDCDPNFLRNDDEIDNTYLRLQGDPVLLCRVIYLLCREQRQERDISEEDFYMEVIGNAIDRATDALLKAILKFVPKRTRLILEAFAEQGELQQAAIEKAVAKINDPKLREKLLAELETKIETSAEEILTRLGGPAPVEG